MVNNRWARLSQNEKAELLGIYTSMGYNDLASIIAHYNSCGGKLYADGGPEEINLGELNPAVITASPSTARGRYKLEKSQYKNAKKENKLIKRDINAYVKENGPFESEDEMLDFWERILNSPSISKEKSEYKKARDAYYGQIGGVNSIPAQLYRYWSRHFGYNHKMAKNGPDAVGGAGADIVDLSKNVIRLSPETTQSTALFNEFVESMHPSVLPAKEYKENPNRIIGDSRRFPASNVSIFGGIDDGKFVLDSLKNFDDNTIVIPARNIKKGTPKISQINIGQAREGSGYDWNKYENAASLRAQSFANPMIALRAKYNDENVVNAAKDEIKNTDELIETLPSLFINNKKGYKNALSYNIAKKKALQQIVDGEMPHSIGTLAAAEALMKNGALPYIQAQSVDPRIFLTNGNGDASKYTFIDEQGESHSISDYNAGILDGKTVLANPNGGVFIGRIQDINNEQLDSLNSYLSKNPSWILRPDLGSFDQYRLDSPSLKSYLKQYFEHPDENDPNVYTIGTTEPNALWNEKADGGPVANTARYKSDVYLYNPPVNVGAPIEAPLRYKPFPDYGDYVPQRTTGMLEDIPIEMGLETQQRGYGVLMPDAPSAMPTLDARQDAARRIMAVENSKNNVNGGYDVKTGRWYPHKSHEGGADTIAYGIKLSNGTPEAALALKQGYLTDEQAESAVDSLVQKYYDAAKRVYDGRYGAGEWDKLSDKSQSILVDYSYNPGLAKFPKLMEGFHSGDLDLIRKNYKRYSGGKELGRNKVLLEELDTLENEYPIFRAEGGKIHIKPENRGKFTALKKRTGHSASWFKAHGTPAQKKMAVFALNSRKWKHGDGGPLANYLDDGGPYNVIPLGGDYLTYLQTMPEVSGGVIEPSVVTAALPSKFNGSQAAAARYAEGYQKGAKPVSEAMNRAGQDIFNTVDTVIGLTPTPAGALTWLGHMGADAVEGRWGRVGRDMALAAALGAGARGIGWLKNYVDDATNYGEDLFRAFTDRVPGRVSTNFTYAAPVTRAAVEAVPAVTNAVSAPYEIADLGGGYMLKSLMRGNPLEKQISKNGTVNVNNVRALVGKGSKVEQAVVDKVLASEEFAGKKSIDYNKFRKAVQDELITYERSSAPGLDYEDYGMDRIGFHVEQDPAGGSIPGVPEGATPKVLLFDSPRIPRGSSKHYFDNTLGHSRTYTTADEPDVLHVMESQSDWAQEKPWRRRAGLEAYSGQNGFDWINRYSPEQANYLADNYTSRQIQENLRYAAEKGQTKMRYPTRETAAKIEGYPEREAYFDAGGNDITNSKEPLTELPKEWKEKYDNIENRIRSLTEKDEEYGSIAFKRHENDKTTWITQNTYADVVDLATQQREILENHSQLKPGITKRTIYDYEDILRKYTEFPKLYRKLYKNADVRIVTDPKGNTWYEVDVPEGYLVQEWAYKYGGKLREFSNVSDIF